MRDNIRLDLSLFGKIPSAAFKFRANAAGVYQFNYVVVKKSVKRAVKEPAVMRHVFQKCIDIGRIGDVAPALSRKKEFFAVFSFLSIISTLAPPFAANAPAISPAAPAPITPIFIIRPLYPAY